MHHSFNVDMAVKYGVEVSIFMQHISYWVNFNRNEGNNFHDGRFWTYNKIKSFPKHFPYWSHKQIERIINKCFDAGLLIKSNFNQLKYDRTCWYTLSDLSEELMGSTISRNKDFDFPESSLSFPEIGTPIPINKPYNKQKIKDKDKAQPEKQVAVVISLPDWLPNETWEEFKQHRKQIKKPMSELAQQKLIKQLDKMRAEGQDIVEVIEVSIANGWQGVFPIKSHGETYGKGNGHTVKTQRFDGAQYLIDKIRARESRESNSVFESSLSIKDSEHLRIEGANGELDQSVGKTFEWF